MSKGPKLSRYTVVVQENGRPRGRFVFITTDAEYWRIVNDEWSSRRGPGLRRWCEAFEGHERRTGRRAYWADANELGAFGRPVWTGQLLGAIRERARAKSSEAVRRSRERKQERAAG